MEFLEEEEDFLGGSFVEEFAGKGEAEGGDDSEGDSFAVVEIEVFEGGFDGVSDGVAEV